MIDERLLKIYIENISLEVKLDYLTYKSLLDNFYSRTKDVDHNGRFGNISQLSGDASELHSAYTKYRSRRRDLMYICNVLGDEYEKIYEEMLGGIE